jgi:hypothetical protein
MPVRRAYRKKRAPMKRKSSYRKRAPVRKARRASFVPKPEVKTLEFPILDLDTNNNAPLTVNVPTTVAPSFPGGKNMTVFIPHNWQFNTQGTDQQSILGRQLYSPKASMLQRACLATKGDAVALAKAHLHNTRNQLELTDQTHEIKLHGPTRVRARRQRGSPHLHWPLR